jgi:seryl-tRNA synthetase
MRITAAGASRVTQPTYEKLKAQLATLDKKIATASKALQDHKDVMARSRYTPEGFKAASAKLKALEKDLAKLQTARKRLVAELAVLKPSKPTAAALRNVIERHLKAGDLQFGAKAPKKEDILTQTEVNKRPFTYVAVVLKSDPDSVIIKKVLTGGIVPARPGDGTYSKPVPLTP